jgi:hypothetical protein
LQTATAFYMMPKNKKVRIRLRGIDSAERGEPGEGAADWEMVRLRQACHYHAVPAVTIGPTRRADQGLLS